MTSAADTAFAIDPARFLPTSTSTQSSPSHACEPGSNRSQSVPPPTSSPRCRIPSDRNTGPSSSLPDGKLRHIDLRSVDQLVVHVESARTDPLTIYACHKDGRRGERGSVLPERTSAADQLQQHPSTQIETHLEA